MTSVTIDIVSDVMCPWCYVGKKRLEKALAKLDADIEVDLHWRPFQLDPTLPKEGRDRKEYLESKFGGAERANQAYTAIREAGADEGIAFDFDSIAVSPNTLDAHRLIRWAAASGEATQGAVVEILFRMYFTEGRNIGDHAVLLDAAGQAGMDVALVQTLLQGDADRTGVQREIATAQQMGVTGVPCFIFEGRYAVMGAQPVETLAGVIADVTKKKEESVSSS